MKHKQNLKQAISVESEHRGTYRKIKSYFKKHRKFPSENNYFKMIVGDHLAETPSYYTRLKKARL
jgi:hypothetical protein